jgi:hypothetical protein
MTAENCEPANNLKALDALMFLDNTEQERKL